MLVRLPPNCGRIVVLINWPGPFSATARDLVDACIEALVHSVERP
jgi:short subunit dehydrogenase-like uncharacterized protein